MIDVQNVGIMYKCPDIILVNVIGHLIVAYLCIYLIQNFFEPKKPGYQSTKQLLTVGTLFAFTLFAVDMISDNSFVGYAGTMILFPFLYACIFFRGKLLLKAMVSIIYFTMLMSLEYLFIELTFFFAKDYLLSVVVWRLIFYLRRTIGVGLLYFLVKVLMIDVMHANTKIIEWYWYFMAAVCLGDYAVLKFMLIEPGAECYAKNQCLALAVCCNIIPWLSYFMISLVVRLNEANKIALVQQTRISTQENYLDQMEEMQENMSKFRHDYQAHLFCMDALLADQRYEELHEYLRNIHKQQIDAGQFICFTQNRTLNLLLNQKKMQADRVGVEFQAEVQTEFLHTESGKIQLYDFNALISNLCDNAIEAASKVNHGKVWFKITRKKAYIKIEVENSTVGNVLKDNPKLKTDKEQKELHGFGIKIIRNIVKIYEGIYETEATNGSFKTSIMLLSE